MLLMANIMSCALHHQKKTLKKKKKERGQRKQIRFMYFKIPKPAGKLDEVTEEKTQETGKLSAS